jgi:hypothetical protein
MRLLRHGWRLLAALLRELADEGAYRRYLERGGRTHSAREWQRFSEARMRSRYARSKCC